MPQIRRFSVVSLCKHTALIIIKSSSFSVSWPTLSQNRLVLQVVIIYFCFHLKCWHHIVSSSNIERGSRKIGTIWGNPWRIHLSEAWQSSWETTRSIGNTVIKAIGTQAVEIVQECGRDAFFTVHASALSFTVRSYDELLSRFTGTVSLSSPLL